jgi:hypothetical protein
MGLKDMRRPLPEITIDEAYSIWRKSDGLEVKTDINERP